MIVPLHVGEFVPFQRPVVYFRRNGPFTLYAVFHRKDYCTWPRFPRWLFGWADRHEYDLEGVLIGPHWSASVFHSQILYHEGPVDRVYIESGGHGIQFTPTRDDAVIEYGPDGYDLVDLSNPKVWAMFEGLRETFNNQGVHLPDQWADGLMWSNPDKVRLACRDK